MVEPRYSIRDTPATNSAFKEEREPGFVDELDAQLKQSWWYQAAAKHRRTLLPEEAGFDPFAHLDGYERYADDILGTRSTKEVQLLKQQIDQNLTDEETIANSSWKLPLLGRFGFTLPGLAAGFADPANLIPVPLVAGIGFAKGALRAGTSGAALALGTEVVRSQSSPTYEQPETAFAVGASFIASAVMGGVSGKFGPQIVRGARQLINDEMGSIELGARGLIEGIAENEYGNQARRVDFGEEGLTVERGHTGVRAADGSYRPAAIVERDVEAHPVREGYSRLYRAEADPTKAQPQQDWLKEAFEGSAQQKAGGRWFTTDPAALEWYVRDAGEAPLVKYIDVPTADLDKYKVSNIDVTEDGLTPRTFSRDPENEFFLPRELADQRKIAETKRERVVKIDEAAIKTHYQQDGRLAPGTGGVTLLPEGSLRSEDEAVTFAILRELWSERLPPRTDETPAAYAKRLNEAALKELQASRVASDSAGLLGPWLDKLNFSPIAKAIRLFPKDNVLTDIPLRIGGDYGWAVRANKFGYRTPPSVLIRSQKHYGHFAEVKSAIDQAFNEAVRGETKTGKSPSLGAQNLETSMLRLRQGVRAYTSKGEEILTYDTFRKMVGRAVYNDGEFQVNGLPVHAKAREAALVIRKKLKDYERQMLELGMFADQQSFKRDVEYYKGWIEDLEAIFKDAGWILPSSKAVDNRAGNLNPTFTGKALDYFTDLEMKWTDAQQKLELLNTKLADASTPHVFAGNENYWPRFFDSMAILADREGFTTLITEWYLRTGTRDGAAERAAQTVSKILGEEDEALGFGHPHLMGLGARHLYERTLDIPNTFEFNGLKVSDFIQNDAITVMETYLHRVGTAIEMTKAFGDFDLTRLKSEIIKHVHQKYIAAAKKEGTSAMTDVQAQRDEYLRHIQNTRDWMVGKLNRTDPWRWDNRVSRDLRAWTTMAYLGKAVVASLVELGRVPMTLGMANALRVPFSLLAGDLPRLGKQLDWMRKEAGEALEMVRDHNVIRHVEETSGAGHGGTAFERWLQDRLPGFFKMTLLTPWTVKVKEYAMLTAQHALLHDAVEVAKAKRGGTAIPEQTAFRLAAVGIGEREAMLLSEMPFETLTGGSLLLPAVHKWSGPEGERAQRILLDAITGETRRTVVTPSIADKSTLFSGVLTRKGEHVFETGFFQLPLQFMTFAIGAHNKITTSMLQGRDRSVFMGMAAMYGIGMIIDWLKTPGYAYDQKPLEEKLLRAYEHMGIGGFWFGDLNRMIENVSGDRVGIRPALGMAPLMGEAYRGDGVYDALGPGPDLIRGLWSAFGDEELAPTRRAQLIRSALIYNNVWYWSNLTRKAARSFAEPPASE